MNNVFENDGVERALKMDGAAIDFTTGGRV